MIIYSTNPGNATTDKAFLLSITEAEKYFSSDSARQCKPTDYAVANGAWESDSGNCWWWLRSPGYARNDAAGVLDVGGVCEGGFAVDLDNSAVRPALWIDLNSLIFESEIIHSRAVGANLCVKQSNLNTVVRWSHKI